MEDIPQVIAVDASGGESITYDPSVTVSSDGERDLFEQPLNQNDADALETTVDPADSDSSDSGGDDSEANASGESDPQPEPEPEPGVPVVQPTVIERYPHDGAAFTQGLEYADGVLIESLGLLGASSRRRVEPTTGDVTGSAGLSGDQFGAGITVVENQIIQLTWQQGVAVVADLTTLIELARFTYEGEGWGLCGLDDGRLVMSNGSGFLTFRDGTTFDPIGELEVTLDGTPVTNLNELECVGSMLYANVWLENNILEIDATTGEVTRIIDAAALVPGDLSPDDVLNGIAYRPETDSFFVTGKRWTVMYEVSFG